MKWIETDEGDLVNLDLVQFIGMRDDKVFAFFEDSYKDCDTSISLFQGETKTEAFACLCKLKMKLNACYVNDPSSKEED